MNTPTNKISLQYSISGTTPAEYAFPSFMVDGRQFLTLQINYAGINTADCKLVFEQSLDNTAFSSIADTAGNPLAVFLSISDTVLTVNITGLNTVYFRLKLIKNTCSAGSINNIIYLTN